MGRRCSESGNPVQRVMATLGYATKIHFLLLVSLYLPSCSVGIDVTWTGTSAVSGIQGQSVNMRWTVNLENYPSGTTFTAVKMIKVPGIDVVRYRSSGEITFYDSYVNRGADIKLTASQSGTLVTIFFTISNLNMTVDQDSYKVIVLNSEDDAKTTPDSTMLTVLVPTVITSPNPDIVIVNETQAAQLECVATGNPNPSFNWTKNGEIIATGSTYTTSPTTYADDKSCYICVAFNGVYGAKTANVCLDTQYKPRNALISGYKGDALLISGNTTVCQNDRINLTCTSGPSKPAPSSYDYYNNGVLLGNSASNVYEATVTEGLPTVNKFVCVPRNILGRSLENGSMEVPAKVAPRVTQTLGSTITVEEGSNLTLACNATGTRALNVTWTRTGKPEIEGFDYPIIDIKRGDAGLYQCTVNNGAECPSHTASITVNVNYKPESTNISILPNIAKFCKGDQVNLTCAAHANPSADYSLHRNNQFVQRSSAGEFSIHLNEKGDNIFTCVPNNTVGIRENKSIQIFVKEAPVIVTSPIPTTVVLGNSLALFCNASGLPAPNITWTKVDGSNVASNVGDAETYNIDRVVKGNEGTYRCTASNGIECSNATAEVYVTVDYQPEGTTISTNKSDNTFLKGDNVRLSCSSTSKPQLCNITFSHGDTPLQTYYNKTCAGADAAIHVINSIDGCNLEEYSCKVENKYGHDEAKINLTINDPPTVNISPTSILKEGDSLHLNCTATGCPTPNITWTKSGVNDALTSDNTLYLSHGPFTLRKTDTGYYKCSVNNQVGSPQEKTIYVNVTYKPYLTNLTSTLSTACLNDSVTLECTTNANPPAHEYCFYFNDELVHTSISGVYQFNVPQAGNNTYKCEPKNTVGNGKNATVVIPTKASPQITWFSPSKTSVEGENVVLMCNVTGSDPINVTWSKVDGVSYPEGSRKTFGSIARGDEATYQCTAYNGNECPVVTARSSITVIYKPENTSITASTNTGCLYEQLTLSCSSHAKPASQKHRFYRNGVLMISQANSNYTFNTTVNGTNMYECQSENSAGNGTRSNVTVIIKAVPVIYYTTPRTNVRGGHRFTLLCNVTDHSGQLNVSWHKVGGGQLSNTGSYTILSAAHNDTGSYECRAHNGNECDGRKKITDIIVTYPTAITQHSNLSVRSNENDRITLTCRVSGVPFPTVNWTRYDELLDVQGQTYSFIAREVLSGNFSCIAYNGIGTVQKRTFDVNITDHCKGHQCENGGTCISKGESYICVCTKGLTGQYCGTEDPTDIIFSCVLIIVDPTWDEKYENKNGVEYQDLQENICTQMILKFNTYPLPIPGIILVACVLKSSREGSIITNTELTFNDTVQQSEVKSVIQSAIVNETFFGNLTLRKSGMQVYPKSNPCSSEPCKFNNKCFVKGEGYRCECDLFRYGTHCEKGIGLIPGLIFIIACIFIFIIAIILCCLYCKKKSDTYPTEREGNIENGKGMKMYDLPANNDHAAANANPAMESDRAFPEQSKETYRPNGTEDVLYTTLLFGDQNKEKVYNPTEKSDTEYAEIISFQQRPENGTKKDLNLGEVGIEMKEKDPVEPKKTKTEITTQWGYHENENSDQIDNKKGYGNNQSSEIEARHSELPNENDDKPEGGETEVHHCELPNPNDTKPEEGGETEVHHNELPNPNDTKPEEGGGTHVFETETPDNTKNNSPPSSSVDAQLI